jgi:hypothetical protein
MSELPVDAGAPSACFIQVLFFPCPWLAWRTGLCPAAPVRLARPALTPALTLETGHIQVLCTGRWFDACYRTRCYPLTRPPLPPFLLIICAPRVPLVLPRANRSGVSALNCGGWPSPAFWRRRSCYRERRLRSGDGIALAPICSARLARHAHCGLLDVRGYRA